MLNVILGFLFTFIGSGDECKQLLINYLEKSQSISVPDEGATYFLQMSMTYKANPLIKGTADMQITNQMYLTSDQSIFVSGQIDVYQDQSEIFVVIHSQKKIIRSKAVKRNKEMFTEHLNLAQRSILDSAASYTCSSKVSGGQTYTILNIKPKDTFRQKTNIFSVAFHFNELGTLISQTINYTAKAEYLFQEIVYESLDLDYKKWKSKKLTYYIFDQKGTLLPSFSGYALIDNRQD